MPILAVNIIFFIILSVTMKAKVVNNPTQKQEITQHVEKK